MTSASLICRVQALYPFESNDPSSLRFEEGDYIDVLAKLPSGWWDGWCNGNRGWFPSNFVKVIEEYNSNTGTASSSTKKHSKRISTDLYEERIGIDVNKRTSLPPNWSIQNREDGSASYYFNTLTGEMRSTYPYDDSTSIFEGESDEDSASSTIDSNSRTESVLDVNFLPSDETLVGSDHSQQGKWIQRTTPQGLPFFYNLSTHETAWHAEDQQGSPKSQPRSPIAIKNNTFPLQPSPSFDNHETLTWNKLSLHVVLTINNLIASAKNAQRSLYKKYAASVVEAVRFMLVASGTINKESVHIKSNNTLRSQHRAMMASMSKLVLSAQLCADGTVTDVSKLLSDCQELLTAVRNFVQTCETIQVEVHQVDPTLLTSHEEKTAPWDPSMRRLSSGTGSVIDQAIRAKYELQPELIENLEAYGSSMHESMETLMTHLTCPTESRSSLAVSLFSQYRSFGNQNGQFLSIIEDIEFEAVITSPLMKDLAIAKQKLYDGLGLLFFKMQTLTDESVPLEKVTHEIQASAQSITEAIKSLCECISGLVTEKRKDAHRNSLLESTEKHPFSDFLRNSTGSNDLSFDLNLSSSITLKNPTLEELHRLSANSKRSQSLSVETNHRNIPTSSSSTKLNRSSAPVSDGNSSMMMAEAMKHRSHTLNEAQSKQATAKLKNFLEESSDPTSPTSRKSSSSTPEEEQRYLQYDYSPNEVVFTTEGMVKGGTLRALVERMTLHDYLDMNFNSTFLLTYRSFCTSMELLELLEARYNIQPPTDLTPEELEIWINKKQKLIRLRVFNVLKIWLEQYYYEEDSVILDRLLFFTNTSIKDSLSFSAIQLERLIHKRKEACKDLKKLVITQPQDSPEPILPRNLKKFKLLDLDPIELARQLTLMDFKMYSSIKPVECLDKAWSKDAAANNHIAANIQSSIDYCNRVTTWVSDEILSQSEVKKRSTLIKYWVNVADRCRMLNNFNTCMAILSAFDNSAVGRLKRTWELVGARTHHIVAQIRKLMGANRNFNNYRAIIHSINPPCIPFLGIYLQDLTFIEDGNPNFLKTSKDLINFAKRAKTGEVIREIQQYQTMGYQFRPVDELQNFISENLHSSRDEDQLYKESLKLEPKEREDEKITRLLQESGFL